MRRTIWENARYLSGNTGIKNLPGQRHLSEFWHGMRDFSPVCWEFGKSYERSFTNARLKIYRIPNIQESKLLLDCFYVIVFENKREIAG